MLKYRSTKYLKPRYILISEYKPFYNKLIELLQLKLNALQIQVKFKKYKTYIIIKTNSKTNAYLPGILFILEHNGYLKSIKIFSSLSKLYKYY